MNSRRQFLQKMTAASSAIMIMKSALAENAST